MAAEVAAIKEELKFAEGANAEGVLVSGMWHIVDQSERESAADWLSFERKARQSA